MRAANDTRTDFNVSLNGYRGLCAMLVFVFHLGSAGVLQWPFGGTAIKDAGYQFWASFSYGVDMFFMISGFVILGSLLRHDRVSGFLQDRVIRIFTAWIPALIAVTAVCIAFDMKAFANTTPLEAAWIFIANLFLLPPLLPLPLIHFGSWSLSYEWVFYLTAAAGAAAYRRWPHSPWRTAAWAVPAAIFICMFPRSLYFVTGVLVFKYRDWFAQHVRWLKFPVVSLIVFLVAWRATGVGKAHLNDTLIDYLLDGRWIFAAIAFVASLHMFASVTLNSSRQFAFLNGPTFQLLGNISYSFYLWHALVMSVTKRVVNAFVTPEFGVTVGFVVFIVSSLAIAIPVSWASWQIFEVRLAKRLRHALKRRAVVAAPVQGSMMSTRRGEA
jgi:peptidoglycan/LPS O-acetylase OafA/YrhL